MRRRMRLGLWAGFACVGTGAASADQVTLTVNLDETPAGGTYNLTGQSATWLTTTFSGSSGGQLDGVTSGATTIGYEEVFPPPSITDYQNFGYFGRVHSFDSGGPDPDDTSLIVALQPGVGIGQTLDQVFAGFDEATLVAAFDTFDSPEFFSFFEAVIANPDAAGIVELPTVPRAGETLDLVAFVGGVDGDLGVRIGDFAFSIVPEPGSMTLMAGSLLLLTRMRRGVARIQK